MFVPWPIPLLPQPEWAILATATTKRTAGKKKSAASRRSTAPVVLATGSQLPRDLAIEWRSVASVTRYSNNPRENTSAISDVAASLKAYGWQQPIVVDGEGVIIVGDTRYMAALQLQQQQVPVYVADKLTPAQAKAYRLADNKVGERAEWDLAKLAVEFEQLQELGADLALTGFRDFEMAPIMAADWKPPANNGSDLESFQRSDVGSSRGVVKFSPTQYEAVLRAAEQARVELAQPTLELPEAIAQACARYAPAPQL